MYAKPTLAPLDSTTASASCCRVVVTSGEQAIQVVNEPLCPFPAPTGDICIETAPISTDTIALATTTICAFAN